MCTDINPTARSDAHDPSADRVTVTERPRHFQQLLANTDFAEPGWSTYFTEPRCFYLEGVRSALRLFRTDSAAFLKNDGFIERALNEPEIRDTWSGQSGVSLASTVSLPRTRAIRELRPTHFQKCVVCMVAFELAVRERLAGFSPFWVYDYLRIKPAVYTVHRFDAEKLALLKGAYPRFEAQLLEFCDQENPKVFHDAATGKTVTRATAMKIKKYIDAHCHDDPSHAVGDVRWTPGLNAGLGVGPASDVEVI